MHIAFEKEDYKIINLMLQFLKGDPIDKHSRAISDLVPMLIEKQLPEVMPYLDSRQISTT